MSIEPLSCLMYTLISPSLIPTRSAAGRLKYTVELSAFEALIKRYKSTSASSVPVSAVSIVMFVTFAPQSGSLLATLIVTVVELTLVIPLR